MEGAFFMFDRIVYISDHSAKIKLVEGANITMNLMNLHLIFEDASKKILGEIDDIDGPLVEVRFLGEIVDGRRAAELGSEGRAVDGIEEAAEEAVIGHPGLDVPVIFFGRVGNSAFFAKEFFPKFRSAGIDVQFPNSSARDLDGARIGGILFEIVRGDATSIEV